MKKIFIWLLQILAAIILLQTLYFKFTAHPESVAIFQTLGMEPVGRFVIGILELISAILLLFPGRIVYGAFLALGLMAGAIFFHITELGFEDDLMSLFLLALGVLVSATIILIARRREWPVIGRFFAPAKKSKKA